MFRFHREGIPSLIITVLVTSGMLLLSQQLLADYPLIQGFVGLVCLFLLVMILQFFRNPKRTTVCSERQVVCPADGKVVVIEETEEGEYFKDKRLQVSIFMSPINVHVNRYPLSGEVVYSKYHPGLYLVAWHPKSSTENERTTVVVKTAGNTQVLFRQIAGALARRIVCYAKVGDQAKTGEEFGFIKFGSRVDLFFPVGTKINVQLNQVVRGGETILAELT
ncbi:MAG: hypothetical protein RIQ47_1297 [Bacteroidota bacterium]|jgi:phosphatidylserine decarboxylase